MECMRGTMLSSKQNANTPKDMAPEPLSLLNKILRRRSGDFGHATQSNRGRSVMIPQMDSDTALPYLRDSSYDKTRLSGSISSTDCNSGHDGENQLPRQTSATNGSVHLNGKLPNGAHLSTDENANSSSKQGSSPESKRPAVSIFERQGARPKIRKSSLEDETDIPLDKSAPTGNITKPSTDWDPNKSREPPCVEMAQPHFPAPEPSCDSISVSMNERSSDSPQIVSRIDSELSQMPNSTPVPCWSAVLNTQASDTCTLSSSDDSLSRSEAPVTKAAKMQLESEMTLKGREQAGVSPDSDHSASAQPNSLFELPSDSPCVSHSHPDTNLETDSTASKVEALDMDSIDRRSLDAHEDGQHVSTDLHQESTDTNDDAADVIYEEKVGEKNASTATEGINSNMREMIMDCVKAALVESIGKQVSGAQTCSSAGSDDPGKHCCTCTCDKSETNAVHHRDLPSKASLTLEDIPQEMHVSSDGSPKPPRTPHIAMLINSNCLFSDREGETNGLSEQDLHRMLNLNAFSSQPTSQNENKESQKPRGCKSMYVDTKAFDAMNISQEAEDILREPLPDGTDDPQLSLGAVGGAGTPSTRSMAPQVDRSSKPKELSEAACKDTSVEAPPPLPPRLPAAPPARRPDPFAAYPIFDDDDDDFPTHEFLHEINMDLYIDPENAIKSRSLPRNATAPEQQASPPELRAAKRGKTVNMKNRFSQIFKPTSKKKRHSTHGFPDRPLPDIPPNPRQPRGSNFTRQTNSALFGTSTGEIVSQQALKEGLLRENPSKEDVDKARELFAISLRKISEYGWYWGPMSWDDAESRLENMPDGSFLVRDSSDDRHLLSLSFRAQGSTHHTRVEHHNGKFSFWSQPCSHGSASIVEFVEEAMRHSHSGRVLYFLRPRMPGFPPAAVQLLYPISRFQKSRSLQHMCRFVIRKHVRLDHIDSLPLPRRLKDYLKEAQYYTQDDILH